MAAEGIGAALADRRAIEDFLVHEVRLLDSRRFEEWRDLFTEDGYYWVPLRPEQPNPDDEASLFYDDRGTMETRFRRLRHPRIHSQDPPTRTCHVIGSIAVDEVDADKGECSVSSTMMMADYRQGTQRVFAGHVRHRLRHDGKGFRIVTKKVDLISCDDVFGVIAVPF